MGEFRPSDLDPKVSGEKITPMAKKATAARNRVNQAISLNSNFANPKALLFFRVLVVLEGRREDHQTQQRTIELDTRTPDP